MSIPFMTNTATWVRHARSGGCVVSQFGEIVQRVGPTRCMHIGQPRSPRRFDRPKFGRAKQRGQTMRLASVLIDTPSCITVIRTSSL